MSGIINPFQELSRPLTETECRKLLAGIVMPLIDMAGSVETVHAAICWFSSNDPQAVNMWRTFQQIKAKMEQLRQNVVAPPASITNPHKPD